MTALEFAVALLAVIYIRFYANRWRTEVGDSFDIRYRNGWPDVVKGVLKSTLRALVP